MFSSRFLHFGSDLLVLLAAQLGAGVGDQVAGVCFQVVFYTSVQIYSFSSLRSLALGLVTLMASFWARSTRAFLFLEETPWAISAQYFLFCIIRTSSSFML